MSKYWLRLLLFGILLGAVPVITIGWISYSISSSDIEVKVKEGNMQVLHQTQMRVEQLLKTLEMSAIQFANSSPVTSTLNVSLSPADFDELRALTRGINHLHTFPGVSNTRLINVENNWYLSVSLFGSFESLEDKQQLLEYGTHGKSLFWIRPSSVTDGANTEEDTASPASIVRMVLKIPAMPITTKPRELLTIDILSSEIRNYLNQNQSLGQYYIIERNGQNILTDPTVDKYSLINNAIIEKINSTNESAGFFMSDTEGEELAVMYRNSPYNGWVYVSIVSIDDITKESKKIALITTIVCIIIIVLIGFMAFYGSRRMYSPVRKLVEYTQGMEEGPLSSGQNDEFTFIEERLRKLSNTGKDLERQVQGQFTQLKEFFVLKLFAGQINENDSRTRANDYGFPTNWKKLIVMTIQIDTLQDTRYSEKDRELLLYAINNMVGDIVPVSNRFTPIVMDHSQVTVLTSQIEDASEIKLELHRIAELIRSKVAEYLQLKVSIGISRAYERVSHTMKAYGETLQSLKRRLSLGYDIIVHYEDIESHHDLGSAIYSHLKLLEDQLIHTIKVGDSDRVDELFQEYIESIVHKGVSFSEYPALMIQLISKVYQVIQDQGGSVNKVLGANASIEQYMKLNTIEEISAWFKNDLFAPVIRFLNDQAETQYLDIANQMVKLIHEKYDEDISLESCASILNFHPVYLSRVFKKEVGVNFSEYLVEYRMNIAKKWLEGTNLKISDIAEKLKYTNTSAFIRTFRRTVGATPGQYREQFNRD
jgi:two-component system, response regulator YesN